VRVLGSRKLVAVFAAGALAAGFGVGVASGAKRHHAPRVLLAAAAQYLQLDRIALSKDLRSGQTLAQIANARGKSVSGLEAALVAAVKVKLDACRFDRPFVRGPRAAGPRACTRKSVGRLVNAKLAARPEAKARLLGAAAAYIGIKPKALATELKGKSLAQVATAHGRTAAGLKRRSWRPSRPGWTRR
jgi:hypothetical protein